MAEESSGDKRHAPTQRRLAQAAERGDVRRSADLPKAAGVAVITLLTLGAAAGLGAQLQADLATWLASAGTAAPAAAARWSGTMFTAIFPLLALIAAVALAASLISGGWVFALNLLKFDAGKLLPQAGLGQIFSAAGWLETGKSVLKFAAIGGAGALALWLRLDDFIGLGFMRAPRTGPVIALVLQVISAIGLVLAVLAAADFALQYWLHRRKLRMSDQEMREEMKDAAGNPHVKGRQRQLARKLAQARQMSKIPEASVIVTNPTHYACAIRYRRGADRAPLLLAKGVGLLAEEIIARGRGLGIPVVAAPPLARAVYRHVEPGEHVPVALYRACAEVLAYVWRMQRWRAQGGVRPTPPPVREGEIELSRWQPEQN
jgi:flagellar biosynthetic protein FlhB